MLTELHIEDLGIIERVELVLGPGLTAITGETGAGKTMLVEALELVVGGRAEPTIVRHGADEARVDARFVDGTREVVLTRVVPAAGRSRAYIDGRPATVAALADAAASWSTCTASTPTSNSCRRRRNGGRSMPSPASTSPRCAPRAPG